MEDDVAGGGATAEPCIVCREGLDDRAFTWPGCQNTDGLVAHRLCLDCLSAMLGSLPAWPTERPPPHQVTAAVGASLHAAHPTDSISPPHLACPMCRCQWTDVGAIVQVACGLSTWPRAPQESSHMPIDNDGRPPRPALPPIFCSVGGVEMDWSTFRRPMHDAGNGVDQHPGA